MTSEQTAAAEIIARAILSAAKEIGKEGASGQGALEGIGGNLEAVAQAIEGITGIDYTQSDHLANNLGDIVKSISQVAYGLDNVAEAIRGNQAP